MISFFVAAYQAAVAVFPQPDFELIGTEKLEKSMMAQFDTRSNSLRELTSNELDNVGGGTSDPGGGPLNGALGPKVDGVINAAGAAAVDTVAGATTGINGVITAAGML